MPKSMLPCAVGLLAGAYSIVFFRELPPHSLLPYALLAALVLLAVPVTRLAGCALFGLVLCWDASARVIAERIEPARERTDIQQVFRVLEFVDDRAQNSRLLVAPLDTADLPSRIRLSWYEAPVVPQIGECWRLEVRLRRPRGLSNPGTFDYEHWLFRNGIGASGYVRSGARAEQCEPTDVVTGLRAGIARRLMQRLPDDDAGAVLLAITVGARHRIGSDQWRRYATTGTSHLMAISGMHVGLVAGGAMLLTRLLLLAGGSRGSHRDRAVLVAILAAGFYAALSGFATPAARAFTMVAIAVCGALLRRPVCVDRLLAATCFISLVVDPISIFTPGFQLSFAAVAVLLWLSRRTTGVEQYEHSRPAPRLRLATRLRQLIGLQFGLLFGLFALTLVNFGRSAWLAPAVNLLVLPVFNLVTLPTVLLGAALDVPSGPLTIVGDGLLRLAWFSADGILALVHRASALPGADLGILEPTGMAAVAACCVLAWVVLPVGWPGRRVALVSIAAVYCSATDRPPPGCIDVHVLDVGQGLSTVVQTNGHTLIFDAGPAFRSGTDTGRLVVTPFLNQLGVRRADLLIVSHADNDHAGGVPSVLDAMDIGALLVGEALAETATPQYACRSGQLWEWDGIRFHILQPHAGARRDGNNASCVLEIRVGEHGALLTGDIESRIERELLRGDLLSPVDLVVVPHHGSATSSHSGFIAALEPQFAVATAGFGNRWGMPRPEVSSRWQQAGATLIETARSGAVSFRMCATTGSEKRREHRSHARRFWHEP